MSNNLVIISRSMSDARKNPSSRAPLYVEAVCAATVIGLVSVIWIERGFPVFPTALFSLAAIGLVCIAKESR